MARKREYLPIGKKKEYVTYHRTYDRLRVQSYILNGGGNKRPNIHTVLWDKNKVESEIVWLQGNERGMVYNHDTGEEKTAMIPATIQRLKEVQQNFSRYQQRKVNEGFYKPTEMPKEMLEERLKLEAQLDVYKEELKELQKRLNVYEEEETEERRQEVLAYGASSCGQLHNGILVELDGQQIKLNAHNVLIIDDMFSPYDGILVADYREHISKPWRMATERLRNKKAELSRQLMAKGLYEQQFKADWKKVRQELIEENGWQDLFVIQLGNKPKIPKVPEHLKNYKKKTSD